MNDLQTVLCALSAIFLLYTVRAMLRDRQAFANARARTVPEPEPTEIGWCFMTIFGEDTLAYGLASEATISGEPWIRVHVPDDADGWRAEVLYRLRDVREFAMADEETCREMAAEDQADDVTELPPIGGPAVVEDKPN